MTWAHSWPSLDLKQSKDSLVDLRSAVAESNVDAPILAHLCRLLAVRSAGHLEFTFDKCLEHFANAKSHPYIAGHVIASLYKGRSVKPNALIDRFRDINTDLAVDLEILLAADDERLRRELAFLVDRRNAIAHGQNHGLRTRKALDLADVALEVGDWIVERLDPRT